MSTISAADVNNLRKRTNAPMMECKAALVEADGDMEKATEILRKKMKDIQVKRGDRETAEGRIAVFTDPAKKIGAIIEMRCESAPVAKTQAFVDLANEVAKQVATQNPANVDALMALKVDGSKSVSERMTEVYGIIREVMKIQRFT